MKERKVLIGYDPASGNLRIEHDFEAPILLLGVLSMAKMTIAASMMRPAAPEGRVVAARFNGVPPPPVEPGKG